MTEGVIRLGFFAVLLAVLLLAEWRFPRNRAEPRRTRRWPVNLGFGLIDTLSLRLFTPWLAFAVALRLEGTHVGLFHLIDAPYWLSVSLSVLLLDLVIYWQHRLMHRVSWLWRLHRVHHTDLALDATSAVRFHPLEILFSLGIKLGAVVALGAPPLAVLIFEIILSSLALFTHANVALPERLDRVLRWVVVTPDMHRIHHSVHADEHNRNFGFNASWWDRWFGTYRERPRETQAAMRLGLDVFREMREQQLPRLLWQPFVRSGRDGDRERPASES